MTTNSTIAVVDVHDQAVDHLGSRPSIAAVELAGAHPDAAAVDGRVRAAVDHRRAGRRDLDPVAVAPDAREHVEVALAVALAVGVVPEEQRHRRHRLGDHELADLVDQRPPVLAPRLHRRAQRARLQLAGPHRQQRAGAHERGAEVGAAAGGEQPHVRRRARRPTRTPRPAAASRSTRRSRSAGSAGGSTPAFMHAPMKPALVPKHVTPPRAANSQSPLRVGLPS